MLALATHPLTPPHPPFAFTLAAHLLGRSRRILDSRLPRAGRRRSDLLGDQKVDLATVEVDPGDLHGHAVTQPIGGAAAIAAQLVALGLELVVVRGQRADVHQPFDEIVVQAYEDAELSHRGDLATEHLADLVSHELALQPVLDVTGRLIGAALGHRTVLAELDHLYVGVGAPALRRLDRRIFDPLDVAALLPAANHRADGAVHDQIGVATDRRGEVGIGGIGEAEVAFVVRRIDRLHHAAQHHRLDDVRIGALADRFTQHLVVARVRLVAAAQAQTELGEEHAQIGQPLRGGALVDAVQRRQLVLVEEARGGDVGRQHALLDDLVGDVARARNDLLDLALVVEDDLGFGGLEVDRTPLGARRAKHLVEPVEILDRRQHRGVFAAQATPLLAFGRLEHRADLSVGQPGVGAHQPLVELVAADLAFLRDVHLADHAEAIDVGVDRTEAVGEQLRKHRQHLPREIDRITPAARFDVERRIDADVIGDVGDCDDQLPAARLGAIGMHRVVEVLRILAIDGDQRQVAQVDTSMLVLLQHFSGDASNLRFDLVGEIRGQVVFADRDLDLHPRVHPLTEDFDHFTLGPCPKRGLLGDANRHYLAVPSTVGGGRRYQHLMSDAGVFRYQRRESRLARVFAENTDQRLGVGGGDLDDGRLGAAAAITTADPRHHEVTVEDAAHLPRRQDEVGFFSILAREEADTVAMTDHPPLDQLRGIDGLVGAIAGLEDLPVAFHGDHPPPHRFSLFLVLEAQKPAHVLVSQRLAMGSETLEQKFTAGNGLIVIIGFALGVGVFAQRPLLHEYVPD